MADRKKDREPEPPGESKDKDGTPPLDKKIPEPPGNLKRREEWFRKRSE